MHVSASGFAGVAVSLAVDSANGLVVLGTNAVLLGRTRPEAKRKFFVDRLQLGNVFVSGSALSTNRLVSRRGKVIIGLAATLVSNCD